MLTTADAAAIAAGYELGEPVALSGPVARGELGEVWHLETSAGRWAVKEPFGPVSPDAAASDARYQEAVLAAGVPIPRPVRTPRGDVLAEVGVTVRVYEWVDLGAPDRMLDPVAVGSTLAAVHAVRHHGATPTDPWYEAPVGADGWDGLIAELRSERAPFAERLAALRDELVALERLLEEPTRLRTCHRDLVADNVRRSPDGTLRVIDWEDSGRADIDHELAFVLFEFGARDASRCRALYETYVAAGGPARVERPGHFTMAIAVLDHVAERACRRWLDPARRHARGHHTARVEEFLDDPLDRATIEAILDALPSGCR